MKIGMRNVKTAISVFICVLIYNLFSSDTPFYATIAAIIAMQSSVIDSFKTGRNRMLGTILGALVGLMFALIQPGNPILCALGMVIIIYLCNLFGWNKAISIAGIVFTAIMVNMGDRSPLEYSLSRIFDTLVGITVALSVNYFIAPPNIPEIIHSKYPLLLNEANNILIDMLCCKKHVDLSVLRREVLSLQNNVDTYASELKLKSQESDEIIEMKNISDSFRDLYHNIKTLQLLSPNTVPNESNLERIQEIFNCCPDKREYVNNETNIVFNYHIDKILDDIVLLKASCEKVIINR